MLLHRAVLLPAGLISTQPLLATRDSRLSTLRSPPAATIIDLYGALDLPETARSTHMSLSRNPRAGRVSTKLVLLLVGVPVVIVLIIGLFVMRGGGPEQVVRRFLMAEATGDVNTMISLMPEKLAAQAR